MKRNFLFFCLTALLLTTAACSDSDTQSEVTSTPGTTGGSVKTELDAAEFVPEGISYEGETFTIIHGNGWGYTGEGWKGSSMNEVGPLAEDVAVGDIINESVVERNRLTEEKLGITIEAIEAPSGCFGFNDDINRSVMAGDNAYDAVCGTVATVFKCARQSLLTNCAAIETLDLTHDWWDQKTVELFNFGVDEDIVYFINGDINYLDDYGSQMLLMNKTLLEQMDCEIPYDLVRAHKWTFDAMMSLCKNVYVDLDGDGEQSFGDQYGLVSNIGVLNRFMPAAGFDLLVMDQNGAYTVNESEAFVTALDKMYDALINNSGTWLDPGGAYSEIFINNNAVFSDDLLSALRGASAYMEDDYGAVPFPLYDESQEQYLAPINDMYASAYGVIITTDFARAGYVLDVMGAYSVDTVTEAVIETTCKIKNVRDEDTVDMIEIVMDAVHYPIYLIAQWGDSDSVLTDIMNSKKNNYVSRIAKLKKRVEKEAASDMEILANPDSLLE